MAIFIIIGIFAAKIKHYNIKCVLRAYPLYPLAFVELFYIVMQAHILFGAYSVLNYAKPLQMLFILSYIPAIICYSLYKPALVGSSFVVTGSILNSVAIKFNQGHMPVFATLSKLTGYYRENVMQTQDNLHSVMGSHVKLPFLCDFIDTGFSVMSVGDLFIHFFAVLVVFYSIKYLNQIQKKEHV